MSDTFEFDDKSRVERLVGTLHDPAATTGDVLTVQADKSIAAQPGGGGSGGVQVVTVPVSSAEILDLFNTFVTLVPAVAGSVPICIEVVIAYLAGATPYGSTAGNIGVFYGQGAGQVAFTGAVTGFLDQPSKLTFGPGPANSGPSGQLAGDVVLGCDTANPTLGDGTLLVTVSYFLAPTV